MSADGEVLSWLIFGCGGVGGYFGARLAAAGQRVSFMAGTRAANSRGLGGPSGPLGLTIL